MIGHLTGILMEKQPPEILLDVQGVGYELLLPMTSFYHLPEVGKQTSLFTHLVVREDAHLLFGFAQKTDRTLLRTEATALGRCLAGTKCGGIFECF